MDEPKLNAILDSRHTERYGNLITEFERQKIKSFEIWPCLMYNNVVYSINASHKMIVKEAKKNGLKEVAICEDDIMFISTNGWEWFLQNKPEVYDIYSGCNYLAFQRPEKPGLIKFKTIVGFQLYMVHERYYDQFLATPDNDHIDTAQKGEDMYAIWPFPALQRPGFSNNNKAVVNYNVILQKEDIYQ